VWSTPQSFDWRNFSAVSWGGRSVELRSRRLEGPGGRRVTAAKRPSCLGATARDQQVVQLDSLVRFLEHPVKAFLRERFGWYGNGGSDQVKTPLGRARQPRQVGGGDRLLRAARRATIDRPYERSTRVGCCRRCGGSRQLQGIEQEVESLAAAHASRRPGPTAPRVGRGPRPPARRPDLVGTVPDVYGAVGPPTSGAARQLRIVRCLYSTLGPSTVSPMGRFLALTPPSRTRDLLRHRRAGAANDARDPGGLVGAPGGEGGPRNAGSSRWRRSRCWSTSTTGMCEPLPFMARRRRSTSSPARRARHPVGLRGTWDAGGYNFGEAADPSTSSSSAAWPPSMTS